MLTKKFGEKTKVFHLFVYITYKSNDRKSEQAHIPHAPTLLENAWGIINTDN